MKDLDGVFELIDKAIVRKGWKRKDLAGALGMSEGWLSKVMSSKDIRLSVEMLLEIAKKLNVDPRSLIPGKEMGSFEDYVRKIVDDQIDKKNKS